VLSDVLNQVEVEGMLTGGFAARGPWVTRGAVSKPLKLIMLVAGSAELRVDGPGGLHPPVSLAPGDVVLLNRRTHLELQGGGEGNRTELLPEAGFDAMAVTGADISSDDVVLGGWIRVNGAGLALLSGALPAVVHVEAARPPAARLALLVERLFDEALHRRIGADFALRQTGQLLLLEVLRAYLEQARPPVGWLRLLADEPLRPALRLIHDTPGRRWSLIELSHAAGMSRTTFAERFRATAGVPPLAYASQWRMLLAQRALRDPDVRIGSLARDLGYSSDSAFSTAFKREIGRSPQHYRRLLPPSPLVDGRTGHEGDATGAQSV
jgi:AraC-like DNA-binding protein